MSVRSPPNQRTFLDRVRPVLGPEAFGLTCLVSASAHSLFDSAEPIYGWFGGSVIGALGWGSKVASSTTGRSATK